MAGGTSKKRPTPGRRRDQAFDTATKIVALFEADRTRISADAAAAGSALRVHELLHRSALLTAPVATQKTGLTAPTINAAFGELERLGIVSVVTGRKRGRVYSYRRFVELLERCGRRVTQVREPSPDPAAQDPASESNTLPAGCDAGSSRRFSS